MVNLLLNICNKRSKQTKHILFFEISMTGAGLKTLEYAKNKNYYVTLITQTKKSLDLSFKKYIDAIITYDFFDYNQLLTDIISYNEMNNIDGVTTTSDLYVPYSCFIAEALNLPSISFLNASSVRNKFMMRNKLKKYLPHLNPNYSLGSKKKEVHTFVEKFGFPIVVKPLNGFDSVNVEKIEKVSEVDTFIAEYNKWQNTPIDQNTKLSNEFLIEKYIEGEEYSVETIQGYNQEIQLLGISKKNDFYGNAGSQFTEMSVSFPNCNDNINKLLFKEVANALKKLSINIGAVHTECKIDNGNVKILEINPRLVGDMLGSHAIENSIAINPCEYVVRACLGEEIIINPSNNGGVAIMGIYSDKKGVFKDFLDIGDIKKDESFVDHIIWANKGDTLEPPVNNSHLIGRFITKGKNAEDALCNARRLSQSFNDLIELE